MPTLRLAVIALLVASPVLIVDAAPRLAGIGGVYVIVGGLGGDPEQEVLRQVVHADVDLRLQGADIRVLTFSEWSAAPGSPALHVQVDLGRAADGQYAYTVQIELQEDVVLVRRASVRLRATTWKATRGSGTAPGPGLGPAVREVVRVKLDQFLEAHQSANARR